MDTSFLYYPELASIFQKDSASGDDVVKKVMKMGKVDLVVLSGIFVGNPTSPIDLFLVGDVDKEKLSQYTAQEIKQDKPIRFTVLAENDFLYRLECNDKFVNTLLSDEKNIIAVNKLRKEIENLQR